MTTLHSALASAGITAVEAEQASWGVVLRVQPGDIASVLSALKGSSLEFTFMVDLFGVDTGEQVEITYHLRSLTRDEEVYVRTAVPYDGAIESVWETYPAALMPEREVSEMFGVALVGHPNPKRLLTTDGLEPMLLKRVEIRTAEEVRSR